MLISYIVPVCNEEKGFRKFYDELLMPEIKKTKLDYEIVLINDGSTDKSLEIIQKIAEADKRVKLRQGGISYGGSSRVYW